MSAGGGRHGSRAGRFGGLGSRCRFERRSGRLIAGLHRLRLGESEAGRRRRRLEARRHRCRDDLVGARLDIRNRHRHRQAPVRADGRRPQRNRRRMELRRDYRTGRQSHGFEPRALTAHQVGEPLGTVRSHDAQRERKGLQLRRRCHDREGSCRDGGEHTLRVDVIHRGGVLPERERRGHTRVGGASGYDAHALDAAVDAHVDRRADRREASDRRSAIARGRSRGRRRDRGLRPLGHVDASHGVGAVGVRVIHGDRVGADRKCRRGAGVVVRHHAGTAEGRSTVERFVDERHTAHHRPVHAEGGEAAEARRRAGDRRRHRRRKQVHGELGVGATCRVAGEVGLRHAEHPVVAGVGDRARATPRTGRVCLVGAVRGARVRCQDGGCGRAEVVGVDLNRAVRLRCARVAADRRRRIRGVDDRETGARGRQRGVGDRRRRVVVVLRRRRVRLRRARERRGLPGRDRVEAVHADRRRADAGVVAGRRRHGIAGHAVEDGRDRRVRAGEARDGWMVVVVGEVARRVLGDRRRERYRVRLSSLWGIGSEVVGTERANLRELLCLRELDVARPVADAVRDRVADRPDVGADHPDTQRLVRVGDTGEELRVCRDGCGSDGCGDRDGGRARGCRLPDDHQPTGQDEHQKRERPRDVSAHAPTRDAPGVAHGESCSVVEVFDTG